MLLVRDVLYRVATVLHDLEPGREFIRWTKDELIHWMNDGAAEIVVIRPAAGARTSVIELQEGVYQRLPEEAILLLDVVRNIKQDDRPGYPIQRTDRRLLDDSDPQWFEMDQEDTVQAYTFDDRNPKAFYNFPPVVAGTKVEVLYSSAPELVEDENDMLNLERTYVGPLVSYMLYRALAKDSDYGNPMIAAAHQQAFMTGLGVYNEATMVTSPKGPMNDTP
jgi:hypothetical protein